MVLAPSLHNRTIWGLSKFPKHGLLPRKLNQSFQGWIQSICAFEKCSRYTLNVQPVLRTIEMWILKFTLLKQGTVYTFFASHQKKSDWHLFFSKLAPGCSRNRTMDSNDSFPYLCRQNQRWAFKERLLTAASTQCQLYQPRCPPLPGTPPQWHSTVRLILKNLQWPAILHPGIPGSSWSGSQHLFTLWVEDFGGRVAVLLP